MPEGSEPPPQKCPACGTPVNLAAVEPLARVQCPACGEKFRVERSFDNFKLIETLGVGGMGSVYKARDTRLERFVALKLLRKELSADPAEAARLEEEARMTAAVNHPNVVQVYSSGSAHGQIYLVMELVDHGSLDDQMAQLTRVPEVEVLRAGIQVAKGLQAAHKKGLIHRDVKPANILFSDAQTAKIGDFGLAGAAEQKGQARKEIWGTPYYVAPERLNNAPEDFRSDIYSLGATLFHALAGKPPIEGETTSATELRQLKSHPPDLHAAAPEVSRETARVINRMLAPNPANRFTSYAHLVDQLQRAYRIAAGGKAPGAPRWVLAGAALVLLAVIAVGVFAYAKRRAKPKPVTPIPSATPDNRGALQERLQDARRQLLEGRYDQAAAAFTKLSAEAGDLQPLTNWARLHSGLVALLQNKPGPARDAFRQIERTAADAPLAPFFLETSRTLAASGPVRESASADSKSVSAFALFLFGIKNWQLSEFAQGAAFLEKFLASEPPMEFAWINDYKPFAKKILDDHRLYTEWKQSSQSLTSASDLKQALARVKTLPAKLQARTVLTDRFREEEKRLSNALTQREKEEKSREEVERKERFAREKTRWLAEWKTRLIADLKTGAYRTPLTIAGTEYQGAVTASESEITLRIAPYGGAPFKWERFSPEMLLSMSNAFIKPDATDAADRQWLAAVFAESSGQLEAAKGLADAAAKLKTEYREWRQLLVGDSK